jgi:rRNA-processing protein FCF1
MEIVLDSCFIIACIEHKIDLSSLKHFGHVLIPVEVLEELKLISKDKRQKVKHREMASLAHQLVMSMKSEIKFFRLCDEVDKGLYLFSKKIKESKKKVIIIATIDKGLIKKVKPFAKVLTFKRQGKIDFI